MSSSMSDMFASGALSNGGGGAPSINIDFTGMDTADFQEAMKYAGLAGATLQDVMGDLGQLSPGGNSSDYLNGVGAAFDKYNSQFQSLGKNGSGPAMA